MVFQRVKGRRERTNKTRNRFRGLTFLPAVGGWWGEREESGLNRIDDDVVCKSFCSIFGTTACVWCACVTRHFICLQTSAMGWKQKRKAHNFHISAAVIRSVITIKLLLMLVLSVRLFCWSIRKSTSQARVNKALLRILLAWLRDVDNLLRTSDAFWFILRQTLRALEHKLVTAKQQIRKSINRRRGWEQNRKSAQNLCWA